jgi:hypothetical protein
MKHINIRGSHLHEAVQNKSLEVCYCPMKWMLVDTLTKALG